MTAPTPPSNGIPDLMNALQRSVEAARERRRQREAAAPTPPSLPVPDAEVLIQHVIVATDGGAQGAGQVVPEDLVACNTCGWMGVSEYSDHLLAAARDARLAQVPDGEPLDLCRDIDRSVTEDPDVDYCLTHDVAVPTRAAVCPGSAAALLAAGYRRPAPTPDGERPDLDALVWILDEAEHRARNESGRCAGEDCSGCMAGRRVTRARAQLDSLVRAHRADDSRVVREVRELADWWARTGATDQSGYDIACRDHAAALRRILAADGTETTGADR